LLYIFDNYSLDPSRRELRCGATLIAIEPQVFDLLVHLIRHRGRVVSRDELIESIWSGRIVSESALSTRINAARGAIGDSGTKQRLIKTLPRKGVRFIGDVQEQQEGPEAATTIDLRAIEAIDVREAAAGLPARQVTETIAGRSKAPSPTPPVPLETRHFAIRRATVGAFAAISILFFGVVTWSYFARSVQSERTRTNIETAAKLTRIADNIVGSSREEYEAVRALRQWAVDLDPHNASALAGLTFVIVAGVLNQWSVDAVTDLHAADLVLQDATRIAPESMIVRGARCHILRAMRQFEAAIKECSQLVHSFPKYPLLHKEIGYDQLMLGQLDEALSEFREADRIAPNSWLRWSWYQGIGLVYLMQGLDQEAIDWLSRAALEAPNAGRPVAYLASAYALAGREQDARDALAHHVKLWPKTTLKNLEPTIGTAAFNNRMQRVLKGLQLAGLANE
jgi:DNA-binding winged helix-turn-helix (wHTH) protein